MNSENPTCDSSTIDRATYELPVLENCRRMSQNSTSTDSRVSPSQRCQRLVRSQLSSSIEENMNCNKKSTKRLSHQPFEEKLAKMRRSSFIHRFSLTSDDYDFHNSMDHGYEFRTKFDDDQNHFYDKNKTLTFSNSLFSSIYDENIAGEISRTDEIHKNPNNLNVENNEETDEAVSTSAVSDDFTKFFQICEDFALRICQLRRKSEIEENDELNVEDVFIENLNKLFVETGKSTDHISQFMKIMRNEKLNNLATAKRTDKYNCRLNRSLYHSRNLKSFFVKLIAFCNSGSKADFTLRFNWFLILNLPDHYFSDYLKLIRIVDFENPNFLWKNFLEFSQLLNENESFDHKQLDILKLLAQFFEESEEILHNLYENHDSEAKNADTDEISNDTTTFLLVEPKFFSDDDADERQNSRFVQLFCRIRSYFKRHKIVVLSIPKFGRDSNVKDYADTLEKCLVEKIEEINARKTAENGSLVLVCWSSMCTLAMRVAPKVPFSALVCFSCPTSAQEQIIQYSNVNIPTMFIVGEKAVEDADFSFLKEKDANFAFICVRNSLNDLSTNVGKLCSENLTQNLIDDHLMVYIERFLAKILPHRVKIE